MKPSTMANRLRRLTEEINQLEQAMRDDKRALPEIIRDAMETERGRENFREHCISAKVRLRRLSEIEKQFQVLLRAYDRNERDAERARGQIAVARAYAAFHKRAGKPGNRS